MLEYAKIILQKVSFDGTLFEKELRKMAAELGSDDLHKLYVWCMELFGDKYAEIIRKMFFD